MDQPVKIPAFRIVQIRREHFLDYRDATRGWKNHSVWPTYDAALNEKARLIMAHGGVLILHSAPESAGATLGVLNHENE